MFCGNCGNKLDNNKFCSNCGTKIENENYNQKHIKYNKFLSNRTMLIMFLINYLLCVISALDYSSISSAIVSFFGIAFLYILVDPFYLISIILCILNIKKYKKGYVICCLIFSVLMLIPMLFINLFLAIENMGIFGSNIMFWIFTIQSLLLILICLFKLIFKIKV